MAYAVQILQMPAQLTGVVRRCAQSHQLSQVVPQACGEVWNFFRASNLPRPGRHVAVYYDCAINLEVGVEVAQPFTGNGVVYLSSTPAGLVATTAHIGPYNRLGDAHTAVCDWCAQQGHALAGPNWEIYGHWDDDPAKLRTDVFYLLRP